MSQRKGDYLTSQQCTDLVNEVVDGMFAILTRGTDYTVNCPDQREGYHHLDLGLYLIRNCIDISLNKERAGRFLVRDRPDTRHVVFLRNEPNKVLRVRQPGCVHEFCQRLSLRSALRASLFQSVEENKSVSGPELSIKQNGAAEIRRLLFIIILIN